MAIKKVGCPSLTFLGKQVTDKRKKRKKCFSPSFFTFEAKNWLRKKKEGCLTTTQSFHLTLNLIP